MNTMLRDTEETRGGAVFLEYALRIGVGYAGNTRPPTLSLLYLDVIDYNTMGEVGYGRW